MIVEIGFGHLDIRAAPINSTSHSQIQPLLEFIFTHAGAVSSFFARRPVLIIYGEFYHVKARDFAN